jgi:nucleotidyltransferase/DNA polymerase involved in DNA repair
VYSGNNKAGMEDINLETQANIIYESSKNSEYFKRARFQDSKVQQKIEAMVKVVESMNEHQNLQCKSSIHERIQKLEKKRDLQRICCVIDMDMFYAAVEIRDNPLLKDLPIAVGSSSMISTANYVARKYGVRSAMPGFIGKKLCPQLVFIEPNFSKYEEVGHLIRAIIQEYDPNFESYSLDEAYFDLTSYIHNLITFSSQSSSNISSCPSNILSESSPRMIALKLVKEIRNRITTETGGLTCSAGIANNFMLAKICADINKPNGQYELPADRESIINFLSTLPTRKVGGIGKVTEKILSSMGMTTMGEVRNRLHEIVHAYTPAIAEFLIRASIGVAEGEGESCRKSHEPQKSMGAERTFSPIATESELKSKLYELCQLVSEDLVTHNICGGNVTLKLKTTKFELFTRSSSLNSRIQSCDEIFSAAIGLLQKMMPISLRLMGVSVSKLSSLSESSNLESRNSSLKTYFWNASSSSKLVDESENSCPITNINTELKRNVDDTTDVDVNMEQTLNENDRLENNQQSKTSSIINFSSNNKREWLVSKSSKSCPVCGKTVFGTLVAFNTHLDNCVNNTSEGSKARPSSILSSNKPILRFFHRHIGDASKHGNNKRSIQDISDEENEQEDSKDTKHSMKIIVIDSDSD